MFVFYREVEDHLHSGCRVEVKAGTSCGTPACICLVVDCWSTTRTLNERSDRNDLINFIILEVQCLFLVCRLDRRAIRGRRLSPCLEMLQQCISFVFGCFLFL